MLNMLNSIIFPSGHFIGDGAMNMATVLHIILRDRSTLPANMDQNMVQPDLTKFYSNLLYYYSYSYNLHYQGLKDAFYGFREKICKSL